MPAHMAFISIAGIGDTVNFHSMVCFPFYFFPARAIVAAIAVIIGNVIGAVHIHAHIATLIIIVHVVVVKVIRVYKYPVVIRIFVYAAVYMARTHWCPSVVAAAGAPANPGRCPLVTGYPYPTVVSIVSPATIVVCCPSPWNV